MKPPLPIWAGVIIGGRDVKPLLAIRSDDVRSPKFRRLSKVAYLAALLYAPSCFATSAIVFVETNRIVLAADGQATTDDGVAEPVCKTLKTGNFFWVLAGVLPPGFTVDILAIARQTLGSNGAVSNGQQVDLFSSRVADRLTEVYQPSSGDGPIVFEIVVTWFEGQLTSGRQIEFQWDGERVVVLKPTIINPPARNQVSASAIGFHKFIDAYLDSAGVPRLPVSAAFAASLIQLEIDRNGGHTGGRISVVTINGPAPGQGSYDERGNCQSR